MKKYVIIFLLLCGCAAIEKVNEVSINEGFSHSEILKIAVFAFGEPMDKKESSTHVSQSVLTPNAGAVLANITARELKKWGKYVVLDGKALEEELKLRNLGKDVLRAENYLSLGKSLGVDAIVIGDVEAFGISYKSLSRGLVFSLITRVSFAARCIDVTTSETVWAFKIKGSSKEDDEKVLAAKLLSNTINSLSAKLK